mmetsp:Transcript_281/g.712  ORF Transcript_281/g.712 Transcript_281/m.712 type:complete len:345 (+) Transcript_281:882-1916(+)
MGRIHGGHGGRRAEKQTRQCTCRCEIGSHGQIGRPIPRPEDQDHYRGSAVDEEGLLSRAEREHAELDEKDDLHHQRLQPKGARLQVPRQDKAGTRAGTRGPATKDHAAPIRPRRVEDLRGCPGHRPEASQQEGNHAGGRDVLFAERPALGQCLHARGRRQGSRGGFVVPEQRLCRERPEAGRHGAHDVPGVWSVRREGHWVLPGHAGLRTGRGSPQGRGRPARQLLRVGGSGEPDGAVHADFLASAAFERTAPPEKESPDERDEETKERRGPGGNERARGGSGRRRRGKADRWDQEGGQQQSSRNSQRRQRRRRRRRSNDANRKDHCCGGIENYCVLVSVLVEL